MARSDSDVLGVIMATLDCLTQSAGGDIVRKCGESLKQSLTSFSGIERRDWASRSKRTQASYECGRGTRDPKSQWLKDLWRQIKL